MAEATRVPAGLLTRAWLRRGWLAWLLWPLSTLYGLLVRLRRTLYQGGWLNSERLPVTVLVVGNVVAGGAGKTPVVMAVVQHLQARGIRVGVISRGYGRRSQACLEVLPDSAPEDVGDEPALIQRRTSAPVFVAARRADAGRALLGRHPDIQLLVCDDGLQHLALQRDMEIGVFDDRGVGNGFLLPAGPLREPWPRPLDLLLHTGQQPAFAGFRAQRSLANHALRSDGSQVALADLAPGKPLLALAAIAQPEAFFAMLRAQNLPLADTVALPDHHDFSQWAGNARGAYTVLCTEKDAVKLWAKDPTALAVPLIFEPEPAFWTAFDQKLQPLLQAQQPTNALNPARYH
ncbi:MAG: tetraacyldisaccharide 4'-kinase [Rhodoferax sp.]|nr:tetraacyldisaccharide 4'-kinase [Rhodoferax sp.]